MPVMDGYSATKAIREWEQNTTKKRIPIYALTASAFDEDRDKAIECGMDGFLTKPIDLKELKEALRKELL